jgi:hypothetical protein
MTTAASTTAQRTRNTTLVPENSILAGLVKLERPAQCIP